MKKDNVEILHETLRILNLGSYEANGKTIELQRKTTRCKPLMCFCRQMSGIYAAERFPEHRVRVAASMTA